MRPIAARAALVAALAAAVFAAAPEAATAADPFNGVVFTFHPQVGPGDAARMASGGVGSVRFPLAWYEIERKRGSYDWSTADATIGNLASHGIEPMPVLFGTPLWASDPSILPPPFGPGFPIIGTPGYGTAQPPNTTPVGRTGWATFLGDAVRRYRPGGVFWRGPYQHQHPGAAPKPVRVWQVWNEPNIAVSFQPEPDVAKYADLLEISHQAIAGADRRAQIAIGGLPCRVDFGCVDYLRRLYAIRGVKRNFDIVDIHPYGPTVPFMIHQLRKVERVARAHGDGAVKLWVGEFGWGSAPPDTHYNAGPAGQARLLRRSFSTFRRLPPSLPIWRVSWFDWRDPHGPVENCNWCAHAGLFDAHRRPKPAWDAFKWVAAH